MHPRKIIRRRNKQKHAEPEIRGILAVDVQKQRHLNGANDEKERRTGFRNQRFDNGLNQCISSIFCLAEHEGSRIH